MPTITDIGALSKYARIRKVNSILQYHCISNIFSRLFEENIVILSQIFKNDMAIPNFNEFCKTIDGIYHNCKNNNSGTVASYIPQLARYSPDLWGVSIW